MPYIKQETRNDIRKIFKDADIINNAGELNYIITNIVLSYIQHKGLRYKTLNDVHGVLSCVGAEIKRRVTDPYEDSKIRDYGDLEL